MQFIENRPYGALNPGDRADVTRLLDAQDFVLFSAMSGDMAPAGLEDAAEGAVIPQGGWAGVLVANIISSELPGSGSLIVEQSLRFDGPAHGMRDANRQCLQRVLRRAFSAMAARRRVFRLKRARQC